MKVVIVGGVAVGATAAARIRRLDESAEILIFERSGYISYANCGLAYYIGDVIEISEDLTLQTPESFFRRFRITAKVHHEVTRIHPEKRTVTVKNLKTGEEWEEWYDNLILSTGAKPVLPEISGGNVTCVFSLRTVEDALKIKEYVFNRQPKSVVLAGGGFIGVELAENLKRLGLEVTVVQSHGQLMTALDSDMAVFLHKELRENGVKLLFHERVERVAEESGKVKVLLQSGSSLQADMAVLSIGVIPETSLAKEAGLALGIKGSILVNDRMETSVSHIYAGGDAVQEKHFVSGADTLIPLAGPANRQGRIIADQICGLDHRYQGSQGTVILKAFDLTVAAAGLNEREAKAAGFETDSIVLSPMNHAGYYPDAKTMTMKILFEKESLRLLGAQIVGYEGVDKRIDVLAIAIRAGMSGADLKDLDLAYAPPYSSAKDPVNLAGYMIDNIAHGILKQWYVKDAKDLPRDGSVTLLDTRTQAEYQRGHAEGFINIPVDELRERLGEIEKGKPVYVMCQSGLRSYIATRILMGNGYDAYNFSGGFRFYDAVMNDGKRGKSAYPCGMEKE